MYSVPANTHANSGIQDGDDGGVEERDASDGPPQLLLELAIIKSASPTGPHLACFSVTEASFVSVRVPKDLAEPRRRARLPEHAHISRRSSSPSVGIGVNGSHDLQERGELTGESPAGR